VSEEGGGGEGAGEGGDAYAVVAVSLPLERLSLDTQAGAQRTLPTDMRRKTQVNCAKKAAGM
jgi:hypothetical protein